MILFLSIVALATSMTRSAKLLRVQLRWLSGEPVQRSTNGTVIEVDLLADKDGREALHGIAKEINCCACKLSLIAGTEVVRLGLKVRRWWESIMKDRVLHLYKVDIIASATDTGIVDFHRKGFCLGCIKEAGFEARQIILCIHRRQIQFDAKQFRSAGYTIRELVNCFPRPEHHPLREHPPVTRATLFDSQLKSAGYSAADSRAAGYSAKDLSEHIFFHCSDDEGLTAGELEWEECCAFFTASELKDAGYDALELSAALFPMSELHSAGFSAEELSKLTNADQGSKRRRYK